MEENDVPGVNDVAISAKDAAPSESDEILIDNSDGDDSSTCSASTASMREHFSYTGPQRVIGRANQLTHLQDYNDALKSFMWPAGANRPEDAALQAKMQKTAQGFVGLNKLFLDFEKTLLEKMDELEGLMDDASDDLAAQAGWWRNANILDRNVPTDVIYPMLRQFPPTDPVEYAQYIRTQMYNDQWAGDEDYDPSDSRPLDAFLERLEPEIKRIRRMPGGEWPSFKLYLDLLGDILPLPTDYSNHEFNSHIISTYERLDGILRGIAISHSEGPNYRSAPSFDIAEACRKLRMNRNECCCYHYLNCCKYNLLLPTLDLLQRCAHAQVHVNVFRVAGRRLPPELLQQVLKRSLEAEEIPWDPRILVRLEGRPSWDSSRICMLPCTHDQRDSDVGCKHFYHGPDYKVPKYEEPPDLEWGFWERRQIDTEAA